MGKNSLIQKAYLQAGLGINVSRVADVDPQAVFLPIFQIVGVVAVTSLTGIRTIVQAGGASTMQFEHSVGPTVLDAGTLSIAADDVDTMYSLTGDPTDAITKGLNGVPLFAGKTIALSLTYGSPYLFLAGPGTIDVTMTAAAGSGSTAYVLTYIPISDTGLVYAI